MHQLIALSVLLLMPWSGRAASLLTPTAALGDISGAGSSSVPTLSADGQSVVFVSSARNLTTNAVDRWSFNVFIRNLQATNMVLVSVATNGAAADGFSAWPSVSGDGRHVAFASDANNLVAGDTNEVADVFVRDVDQQATVMASAGLLAGSAPLRSGNPLISSNGNWVFFESTGMLPEKNDTNGGTDVFARQMPDGEVILVSRRAGADEAASKPATLANVTPDGRYVAFISQASDEIISGTGNDGGSDVYIRDMVTQEVKWVSPFASYFPGAYVCAAAALSSDGRYAMVMVTRPGSATLIFRRDVQENATTLVASNATALESAQMSSSGRYVLYGDGTNIYRWDADVAESEIVNVATNGLIPSTGVSRLGRMSPRGTTVAFISSASGLTINAAVTGFQIYRRNMLLGQTELVSVQPNGGASAFSYEDAIMDVAGAGDEVVFSTAAADLIPGDLNRLPDVYLHRTNRAVEIVSLRSVAHPLRQSALAHSVVSASGVSGNGNRVAFRSFDSDLTAVDTNKVADAFVADVGGVAVAVAANPVWRAARSVALSGDGQWVIVTRFVPSTFRDTVIRHSMEHGTNHAILSATRGRESAAPAVNANGDVVVYRSGGTMIVYNAIGGTNEYSTDGSFTPLLVGDLQDAAITPDSRFVLYASGATLFAWDRVTREVQSTPFRTNAMIGLSGNSRFVTFNDGVTYRRDLIARTNMSLGLELLDASISGDGRFVVGATMHPSRPQIVLIDCETRQTNVLSISAAGEPGNGASRNPVISANGRYVAFRSLAANLIPGGNGRDHQVLLRDRLLGTSAVLSRGPSGAIGNGSSSKPIVSLDGSTIVFQSMADNLVNGDHNDRRDIFAVKIGAADSDGDGMDDDWEIMYFGDLSRMGAGDFDNDGASDRDEFVAGTDPTNGDSLFRITRLTMLGGGATQLIWIGNPSRTYRLEYKVQIETPGWAKLDVPISWTGSTATAIDPNGGVERFYRVVRE